MNDREETPKQQEPDLKTACPFCVSELDVHLDVKGRPYWRCWRCEVRSFGTKTAFSTLQASGWIWSGARPVEGLKGWIGRVMERAGLLDEGRER
jgi:hypothetical protein